MVVVERPEVMSSTEARSFVRDYLRLRIDGEETLYPPALRREILAICRDEPPVALGLLSGALDSIIADLVQQVVSEGRHEMLLSSTGTVMGRDSILSAGAELLNKMQREKRVRRITRAFGTMFEKVERGVQIAVLAMTNVQLQMAAVERRKQGATEFALADLWDEMASKLPEGAKVGEYFTEDELVQYYDSLDERKVRYTANA